VREVMTPEGVPVRFEVAEAGDRAAAFLLDLLAVAGLTLLLLAAPIALAVSGRLSADIPLALAVLLVFLVRTFYFTWFELRWQGATPGKRRIGLRAVDARGGPVSAEAIVARNLTREVEVFLPLAALSSPELLWPGAPGWARLVALVWLLVLLFLPLLNRDRLRVGDLVAGTLVVRTPAPALQADLAKEAPAALAFTPAQLDAYGIYELQVLEGLLRAAGPTRAGTLAAVATQVRSKIGWTGPVADPENFLRDFYAAMREHLERRLLFGKRRADKHDRTEPVPTRTP
jgi:uncharacterized RDD family membrane protein YckC